MYFTIVVPTRNRPDCLKICLNHMKLQTFTNFEVLIIDDGSNTKSSLLYSTVIPQDSRFKLINKNNPSSTGLGASATRNIGLNKAQGLFIGFCDDDDFWIDNDHLLVAYETLNNSNIDLYIANQKAVKSDGNIKYDDWFPHLSNHTKYYKTISIKNNTYLLTTKQVLKEFEIPQLNTLIVKKSICTQTKGFWTQVLYVEDRDFYLRSLEYCENICYRKDIVSQHNIPDKNVRTSLSNSISEYEQHIIMISVLNHVLTTTKRKDVIQYCNIFLGWKYRNLALITNNLTQLVFAKNAINHLFTVKWFLFTQYLNIKNAIKVILHQT